MTTGLLELLSGPSASGIASATLARAELIRCGLRGAPSRVQLTKASVMATYSVRRDILRTPRPALAQDLDAMLERLAVYEGDLVALHSIPLRDSIVIIFTDDHETLFFGGIVAPRSDPDDPARTAKNPNRGS